MKCSLSFSLLAALFAIGSVSNAAPLANNGGFEVAGGGGATDSDLWVEIQGGISTSERSSTVTNGGSFSHELFAAENQGAAGVARVLQNSINEVGLGTLVPGTTIDVSFDWNSTYGVSGGGNAILRILDSAGGLETDQIISLPDTAGAWQTISFTQEVVPAFGAFPNDQYAVFVDIGAVTGAVPGGTSLAYVDNVVIDTTVVPEPSSLALLGLGGAAVVLFRMRKRAH